MHLGMPGASLVLPSFLPYDTTSNLNKQGLGWRLEGGGEGLFQLQKISLRKIKISLFVSKQLDKTSGSQHPGLQ